jgi:imidazoleglycerol-phosphate dehydratase/histidinol-phosphatase
MNKILFIDRDGTIVSEPEDYQLDSMEKLSFYPEVFSYLSRIYNELGYTFIMVTNQDGLGTKSFPENIFWPTHNFIIESLKREGVYFKEILIDRSFPEDNSPNRKPSTGMLSSYINNDEYDLENSFVIGDRLTDMELAKNLGSKGVLINNKNIDSDEVKINSFEKNIVFKTNSWKEIYSFLKNYNRMTLIERRTKETYISVKINLDGTGKSEIKTGLSFFDHMLDQLARHGSFDLFIDAKGDLHIDEHHTIEDTAIALGEAFLKALGNKIGIERYGFSLPMDDCLAQVSVDFGGRSWLVWEAEFKREMIGEMPTEMFFHFFKSFTESAKANLNIKAEGINEHHKIESIFKAFAKSLKAAVKKDSNNMILPSTKGSI